MKVAVSKLDAANVNQHDGNTEQSAANQNAVTVKQTGNKIEISGNLADMNSFKSTNEAQGTAKWVALVIDTGQPSITSVAYNGKPFTQEDVAEAASVNAPEGSFVWWLKAENVKNEPAQCLLTSKGYVSKTLTVSFNDTSPSGADRVEMPSQETVIGDGSTKKISDLVSEDATIQWDGIDGKASGEAKYISDFKEFYGESEATGHFFPVKLADGYKNKDLTVSGGTGEDKPIHIDEDLLLITRIENLDTSRKVTVKDGGETVFTVDFTDVKLDTVSIIGQDELVGYGQKKGSDLMGEDVKMTWEGNTAHVTGTFHNVEQWEDLPKEPYDGHFFAMRIDNSYLGKPFSFIKDSSEPSTVEEASADEMFWILRLDDCKKFTFKSGEDTIAVLDFSDADLSE